MPYIALTPIVIIRNIRRFLSWLASTTKTLPSYEIIVQPYEEEDAIANIMINPCCASNCLVYNSIPIILT